MKVAILTMFRDLRETYSVVQVVAEHLYMMLEHQIDVKLIVTTLCKDHKKWGIYTDERIEWVYIPVEMNNRAIELREYTMPSGKLHDTFYEEAEFFAKHFHKALEDVEVCMMHDILYQGKCYVYNVAIRKVQKLLNEMKFIAITHSFPVNRPLKITEGLEGRYMSMPNTVYVYPSRSGITALAAQYDVPIGRCEVVYNAPSFIKSLSEEVKSLHQKVNLLRSEILIVYPGRLSEGKKFEKVAALAGAIKTMNEKTVQIIFCDAPDKNTNGIQYKNKIRKEGRIYGLADEEMLFTSEVGYEKGFPHQGILDLFTLSNLFICPSYSEGFSLTTLEAASRGNFLVLNECVPALEEAGNLLHGYFMKWDARNHGYDTIQNYHPSERAYYEDHSKQIVSLMREDRVCYGKTVIRQRLNSEWIWENQLSPLLEV